MQPVTIVGAFYGNHEFHDWMYGDFDYNGFTDDTDITLLGAYYSLLAPAI